MMMKCIVVLACIGVSMGFPFSQRTARDGFREDSAPSVYIHSGYANIRRQGRMQDTGSYRSQRQYFKKGRTMDGGSVVNEIEKLDLAPVFMGFSEESAAKEHKVVKTELKETIDVASKLAIEKMEKDILNAINPSPNDVEETSSSTSTTQTIPPTTTTTTTVPTTTTTVSTTTTTTQPPSTERVQETTIVLEEETTTTVSTTTTTEATTTTATTTTTTTVSTTTTDEPPVPEAEAEAASPEEVPIDSTYPPTAEEIEPTVEGEDSDYSAPESSAPSSTVKQQPSEEIDLGSVEEVIS